MRVSLGLKAAKQHPVGRTRQCSPEKSQHCTSHKPNRPVQKSQALTPHVAPAVIEFDGVKSTQLHDAPSHHLDACRGCCYQLAKAQNENQRTLTNQNDHGMPSSPFLCGSKSVQQKNCTQTPNIPFESLPPAAYHFCTVYEPSQSRTHIFVDLPSCSSCNFANSTFKHHVLLKADPGTRHCMSQRSDRSSFSPVRLCLVTGPF